MYVAKGLKRDPDNQGWVMGWAVIRLNPWHLVGLYTSKDIAEKKALLAGEDYEAVYGSHLPGTDDFIFEKK